MHLIHQRGAKNDDYPHTLSLAHGKCQCRRDTGRKGVPRCFVLWVDGGDSIDLFPEGFLLESGCSITKGASHSMQTPKGRSIKISLWGSLPYLSKDDLNIILNDLPDVAEPGRSRQPASEPTVARASKAAVPQALVRAQLKHLMDQSNFVKKSTEHPKQIPQFARSVL